jgi:hypothetical protein
MSTTAKNYYPEKPELPYQKTSVSMNEVIAYLKTLPVKPAVKVAAYVMFRNEAGNGKYGVNHNYAGIQGDAGRWDAKYDASIIGTCIKAENMTGKVRRFLCFASFKTSIDFLVDRVQARGLYIGGYAHLIAQQHIISMADWASAYYKEWVQGSRNAKPTADFINSMCGMCKQGKELFVSA